MTLIADQPALAAQTGSKERGTPPLHNGDRLSRAEFEQIYKARPDIKKAELIEGVVYMSSPLYADHAEAHSDIDGWLAVYRSTTPGIRVMNNLSVRLDADNEVQPDVAVFVDPQRIIPVSTFVEAIPALAVQIASSSAAYDLHQKLHVYRRNGVQEYLVLLVHEKETRWYRWQEGDYRQLQPDAEGILRSEMLPGLWFHSGHFWQRDLAGVLAVLQKGIASPDHEAFVKSLSSPLTAAHSTD
ncbi:MAG: Uma2 family endonuclease [Caldilineaceae bacterium]|nr:Uma2 family endonuclease [Caldilineaceae bacterium]